MEYTILVYRAEEGGFWAEVPALPGCYSQGETIEETMENVKEVLKNLEFGRGVKSLRFTSIKSNRILCIQKET